MRSWTTFLSLSAVAAFAAAGATAGGCSGDDNNATLSGTTVTVGSGGGHTGFGCENDFPDGFCNLKGGDGDTCECSDCEEAAFCRGTCSDDGQCGSNGQPNADEDCSCDDCWGKASACPPYPGGCRPADEGEPPECTADEDCTCAECTNTARCTDNCFNNGQCVEYFEGCSCTDCGGVAENCGGMATTTTTTTTSSGGGGGAGGASGSGGAGGM